MASIKAKSSIVCYSFAAFHFFISEFKFKIFCLELSDSYSSFKFYFHFVTRISDLFPRLLSVKFLQRDSQYFAFISKVFHDPG